MKIFFSINFGIRENVFTAFVNLGVFKNIFTVSKNVIIRKNISAFSEVSETAYYFFMVSNNFGNAIVRKKVFIRMSGEFYFQHMFSGLRWMKMAGTVKADHFDLTTSDKVHLLNLLLFLKNKHLYWSAAILHQVCLS